ncbi:MAG: hypothetical protein ACXW03_01240 [Methylobacter sp.]
MNNELLELAHSRLLIHEILLHSSEIKTNEGFCPLEKKSYEIQFKQFVKDSKSFEAANTESDSPINFIIFHYVAGFRALPEGLLLHEVKESEILEKVEAEVVATFSAIYRLVEEIPVEAVREFAKYNVGFNVWPFWREYASSTATRLGLQSFPIPLYRVPKV